MDPHRLTALVAAVTLLAGIAAAIGNTYSRLTVLEDKVRRMEARQERDAKDLRDDTKELVRYLTTHDHRIMRYAPEDFP